MQVSQPPSLPKAFLWRRLHSLTGVFLVLFLLEHLLTNSQAALFLGEDGAGFIRAVNFIHSLPYLPAIEVFLLGMPILIHAAWGIRYLLDAEPNSWGSDGSRTSLGYSRNRAYTWQRITSWILLVAILAHVVQMRFLLYPEKAMRAGEHQYMVRVEMDDGLYTVAQRLGVQLYDGKAIEVEEQRLAEMGAPTFKEGSDGGVLNSGKASQLLAAQERAQRQDWLDAVRAKELSGSQVIAVAPAMGTAILLTIRDTMKDPTMMVLYTIFVLAASFHAFNGLWTAGITWGITLTPRSQDMMKKATLGLMGLVMFLGLSAIWATYWFNLFQ